MLTRLALAAFLLAAPPTFAQDSGDPNYYEEEQQYYENCIAQAYQDADAALDMALTWRDTGGGLPARHCVAVAYTELGEFEKAAEELETLADEMRRGLGWSFADKKSPGDRGMLKDVYAQAGNAWMLANDPYKAYELFTLALGEAEPKTQAYADLLVDRSIARATADDYEGAIEDLSIAQLFVKESVSIYVLKASAYRALEQYDKAKQELDNAFRINPTYREALLERGNLRRETGDDDGAREDWIEYLRLYPNSPAADDVRKNLEQMDVNVEDLPGDPGQP